MKAVVRRTAEPVARRVAVGEYGRMRRVSPGRQLSIQREADGAPLRDDAATLVQSVLNSPGRPLDARTRAFMEPRFGYNLTAVRVHADETAARSADAISAHAYTVGSHIVFGRGQFAPGAPSSQHTIAHELTHVIQQARGPVAGTPIGGGVSVSHPGDQFERSAAAAADIAMSERGSAGGSAAPLAALPAASGSGEPVALQRVDWGKVGGISGIVGAVVGGLALIVAGLAWLWPRNPNATAQGINMQPNPFAFQATTPPETPDQQQKYVSAAEGPARIEKVLELRTDDSNDATFDLERKTDGTNIISAGIKQGETKGYLGGYNSSIATLVLSAVQTYPPPALTPPTGSQQSSAGGPPAPAAQTQAAPGTESGRSAAPSAGGVSPGGTAPSQVAREVIHFSGTNGPSRDRLQTYGGELLVTGDGNVVCTRCDSLNGFGYGVPQGTFGLVDYRSLTGPTTSNIGSPFSAPGSPFPQLPQLPNPIKDIEPPLIGRPVVQGGT